MGKTLYLECVSGISGDMTVAALLDLGADEAVLLEALQSLPLTGYTIHISRVKKAGLDVCDFDVELSEDNHDHDMEYLHGHSQGHSHEDTHRHAHGEILHIHRGMKEIREIINAGALTEGARTLALRIFEILAEAEAKAHGVPANEVHFHEVGAVDSIVDIVAAAVCFDNLGITDVVIESLSEGKGTVRCQHGILPVPVPAVANIAAAHELMLKSAGVNGELVTPTGAAIAAAVCTRKRLPEKFAIEAVGLGAGKREYGLPGILRAMLIREDAEEKDEIYKLETNVDDSTGEALGYVMERLLNEGARDVFYMPVYMKKNRPAWLLSVICREEDIKKLEDIIFRETTTIGIRRTKMERTVLAREQKTVSTPFGEIQMKVCSHGGETYWYPEYESLVRICRKQGISYKEALKLAEQYPAI
jgi:uncharacterized protein (TIGR00299 family) protein